MQSVAISFGGSITPKDIKNGPKGKGKRGEYQVLGQLPGNVTAHLYTQVHHGWPHPCPDSM